MATGRAACERPGVSSGPEDAEGPLALTRRLFVEAILAGQRTAATTVASEALRNGTSLVDLYADVFQAALYDVGRRWEANRITVADEHMATAITQHVLGQIYAQLELPAPTRGRLLVAGVPGELHQVGANMIADVLEAQGWDVRFLGTNVPQPSILAAVEKHAPDVVGLSATMLPSLPALRELLAALRRLDTPRRARLIVGGTAVRVSGTMWREWGADLLIPDVRDAVRVLCSSDATP
jgi:methanogenic corrinoid protein MtbC1